MKSFLPNDIKDQNRKIILDILLQEPELAKVEVTERTTMSLVTVGKIMDFFEGIGIVTTNGVIREGMGGLGRKRVVYSFNENSYLTIGIQVIGNKISAVLVNLYSEVIASYDLEERIAFWNESFIATIKNVVDYFQEETKKRKGLIIGIGIAVDGAINKANKTLRMRSDMNKEEDYLYKEILEKIGELVNLPIILENDVNASTIAEFSYLDKGGEGPNDLLQIALGEGIGAGIILDKKLHRGHNAGVGELEYMCFDAEYTHVPSSVGWLENKLNLEYLMNTYKFTSKTVEYMNENSKRECVDYISRYLALSICNTVSLLDIPTVILSGKTIFIFQDDILKKIQFYIKRYTGWQLKISISERLDSTAVGVAILSLQNEMAGIISG